MKEVLIAESDFANTPPLLDYLDQARARNEGCVRQFWHIPVVFDLVYDRVRSREVAVLSLSVFLMGLFVSAILGNGDSCEAARMVENPLCTYVNDTIIPVTEWDPTLTGELVTKSPESDNGDVDYGVYILFFPLALLANSQWSSRLWILPSLFINFCGALLFAEDYPYCTFATLPNQQMPYSLTPKLASLFSSSSRLCMGTDMKAYWPPLYESNGTQYFLPCDILAMQSCENDSDNILADVQTKRVLYAMFYLLTVCLFLLCCHEIAKCCHERRMCSEGLRAFERAQQLKARIFHALGRPLRGRVENTDDPGEEWQYPTRMLLGATITLVVLYCVIAYSVRLFLPMLDDHVIQILGFGSLVYAVIISGSIACLCAVLAVAHTLYTFRRTAIALLKDGGVQLASESASARLVIHSLPRAQISSASSFVGTWIGRLLFATYLCWLVVLIVILVFAVPLFRAMIWGMGMLILQKVLQLLLPIIQYYCFVGTVPLRIRHPRFFFMMDLVNTIISGLAGVITAALTLLKGIAFIVVNMYFIDRSILPHPWEMQDAGFSQYCAVMAAYQYKIATQQKPD